MLISLEFKARGRQIKRHNGTVLLCCVQFLADEFKRKENKEFNIKIEEYTKWIAIMTLIMLILTINVFIVFYG